MSGASPPVRAALGPALAKASWRLLPMLGLAYLLAYVDRVNVSFAEPTMSRQLHFSATVYGTGAGIFFVTYAAVGLPSTLILARVGPRRWLAGMMGLWGLVGAATLLARSPEGFWALRLLLGAAEGGFFPGVIYTLTLWFPAAHRGRAVSRFYVAAPIATLVMGAAAGAILKLDGTLGLAGWQWLFLLEGAPSCLVGLVLLAGLADAPAKAPWLSVEERAALTDALTQEGAAIAPRAGGAILGVLADPAVLMMAAANFLILGLSYAVIFSGPRLLQEAAHLSPGQSGSVVALSGILGAVSMLGLAWLSDRLQERFIHLSLAWTAAAMGVLAMAWAASEPGRGGLLIAGFLIFFTGHFGAQGVFWAAMDRLLAPSQAAAGIALITAIGQLGSFLAPIAWGAARDMTGDYSHGLLLVGIGVQGAGALALWLRVQADRRARRATP